MTEDPAQATGTASRDDQPGALDHLLSLLPEEDRQAVRLRLDHDAAARQELTDWAEDFLTHASRLSDPQLAARTWDLLQARLWPAEEGPKGLRGFIASLGIGELVIGTALAAGLAWLAWESGLMVPDTAPDYAARIRAETPAAPGDLPVSFDAAFDADHRTLTLEQRGREAAEGHAFQLWLVSGDADPLPLLVWPAGELSLAVTLQPGAASLLKDGTLGLSEEPADATPAPRPTGPMLAQGKVQPASAILAGDD